MTTDRYPRRPRTMRLDPQQEKPAEQHQTAADKTVNASPDDDHPRAPRAMPAPAPEQLDDFDFEFDDAASKGEIVPANHVVSGRGLKWGTLFIAAVTTLVSLGLGLWFTELIEQLFARGAWLGWLASGLMLLAGLALFALIVKEVVAIARLRKLGDLRRRIEQALQGDTKQSGEKLTGEIRRLYAKRPDMAWHLSKLTEHDGEIVDDSDRIHMVERDLMAPLDEEAKRIIMTAAKRISVVTAVNPVPAIDVLFVAFQIVSMMRKLAGVYGGRPGTMQTLKLSRMVLTHLSVAGGLALSETLTQEILGKGIAGRLSAKFGEGTVNGILSCRIGLAAMDVCRPMPFSALQRPGLKQLLGNLVGSLRSDD